MKGWKYISHSNGKQKKAEVVNLISDNVDVKIKTITRDKKGHYTMIKGYPRGRSNNCKYWCTAT